MSFRLASKHLGLLFLVLSAIILLVAIWSGIVVLMGDQREATAAGALLISGVIGGLAGGVLWMAGRGDRGALQRREALLLVAASWGFGAALAGLPYLVWAYLAGEDYSGHVSHRATSYRQISSDAWYHLAFYPTTSWLFGSRVRRARPFAAS